MFRNREIRKLTLCFSIIAAVSAAAGFAISAAAGSLVVLTVVVMGVTVILFTRARYKAIAQISEQIDRILHNDEYLYIGELDEGELSILHSEITKMTLRIREQNEALKKEKEHLADSLADIAHQLRTPLTSAGLILSLLENNPDEREQRNLLREVEELFVKMDWLINSLLKLSRLDAGIVAFQKERIEVYSLINHVVNSLLIPMELHNISIQVHVPNGVEIWGDYGWFSEAIQNILKNCMEGAGDNGKIEILCEDTMLFTELTIHDSGKGFEKEDLPHLFERFYRGKQTEASGYGIGLALCKTIITRQGGTITAKNHPKGGALFSVRFPK